MLYVITIYKETKLNFENSISPKTENCTDATFVKC
jgi:hypothetical protein